MRGFPASLLAQWPDLAHLPFDADGPMVQAFARLPARLGVARYHKGRTAIGHLLRGHSPYSLLEMTPAVRQWVAHLLRCGADPDQPLARHESLLAVGPNSLRQAALSRPGSLLLDLLHEAGIDPMAAPRPTLPWGVRVHLAQVLRHRRIDWLERYAGEHAMPWESSRLIRETMIQWEDDPALAARGVERLLAMGHGFDPDRMEVLWLMVLRDPQGPWLGWALDRFDATPPCADWGRQLGKALLDRPCPGQAVLRAALEARLPPGALAAWAPHLPDLAPAPSIAGNPALTAWMGDYQGLEQARAWPRLLGMLEWAVEWGLPPAARTPSGLPWALAVFQRAWHQAERFRPPAAALDVAWQCMECLARAGHPFHLRPRQPRQAALVHDPCDPVRTRTAAAWLSSWPRPAPGLPTALASWPARYGRLRAWLAMERGIRRRLEASGRGVPVVPAARTAPRL